MSVKQVPVVVSLDNWVHQNKTLEEWLVGYLHKHYDIETEIGRYLVRENQIVIVFIGLPPSFHDYRTCYHAVRQFWMNSHVCFTFQSETEQIIRKIVSGGLDAELPADAKMWVHIPDPELAAIQAHS